MKKSILIISSALLALSSVANVQAQSIAEIRDELALYPATGLWWTPGGGEGRWGVQIEVQTGQDYLDGWIGATVYSYAADGSGEQAWYAVGREYEYNFYWREDGYISKLDLQLQRTANGTCLTCEDGSLEGETVASDVTDAEITFFDSLNGELRIGDVVHPLVKAQWGDGVGASSMDFWMQPFQFQADITISSDDDGSVHWRFIDFVQPLPGDTDGTHEDAYEFMARGEQVVMSADGGMTTEAVNVNFEIVANDSINEYSLLFYHDDAEVNIRLFPMNRNIIEGRSVEAFSSLQDGETYGQVLMVTTPSMQDISGETLPYPFKAFSE